MNLIEEYINEQLSSTKTIAAIINDSKKKRFKRWLDQQMTTQIHSNNAISIYWNNRN